LRSASPGFGWRDGRLVDVLYVPETFRLATSDVIRARRFENWSRIAHQPVPLDLVVLIGEVKRIEVACKGMSLIVKHVPDCKFALSDRRYVWADRLSRSAILMSEMFDDAHLVVAATVTVARPLEPTIACLSFMLTTPQWLPMANGYERAVLTGLVGEGRSFVVNEDLFPTRRGRRRRASGPPPRNPAARA
jgi:uncharacterized protein DUF1173